MKGPNSVHYIDFHSVSLSAQLLNYPIYLDFSRAICLLRDHFWPLFISQFGLKNVENDRCGQFLLCGNLALFIYQGDSYQIQTMIDLSTFL